MTTGPNEKKFRKKPYRVILCAGGTGGHVFPALIVARELGRMKEIQVELMVDQRGSRYLGSWEGSVWPISIPGGNWIIRLVSIALCTLKIWWRFLWNAPDLVIGFGGYPAASGTLAALLSGVPYMIQEQNCVLGRVNRWMAFGAKRVFLSFKKTLKASVISDKKKRVLSFPLVAREWFTMEQEAVRMPAVFTKEDPLRLLVIGGSQGSTSLALYTKGMTEYLSLLDCARIHITLQAPDSVLEMCSQYFKKREISYQTGTFFTSLPRMMRESHLIMARSGASTVSEIELAGVPSILMPLPNSASNHQFYNCDALVNSHRAWRFEEKNTTDEDLATFIRSVLKDPTAIGMKKKNIMTFRTNRGAMKDPAYAMATEVDSFLKGLHKEEKG